MFELVHILDTVKLMHVHTCIHVLPVMYKKGIWLILSFYLSSVKACFSVFTYVYVSGGLILAQRLKNNIIFNSLSKWN